MLMILKVTKNAPTKKNETVSKGDEKNGPATTTKVSVKVKDKFKMKVLHLTKNKVNNISRYDHECG